MTFARVEMLSTARTLRSQIALSEKGRGFEEFERDLFLLRVLERISTQSV